AVEHANAATTRPTTARADAPATSRARSDISSREAQAVADAPYGLDQRGPGGVQLLSQVGDVGLEDVGVAAEVVLPHVLQELRLGEHPPGVEQEVAEKLELGGREL